MISTSASFARSKESPDASCCTYTAREGSLTCVSHPATVWKHCVEIGKVSTASASTINGGFAFVGVTATPTRWKSSTTIEERSHA